MGDTERHAATPPLTRRVRGWVSGRFGNRSTVAADLRAGTVLGLESVPDSLANGLLAGVNPLLALHGYLVGTIVGALTTSTVLMSVQATSAMAVAGNARCDTLEVKSLVLVDHDLGVAQGFGALATGTP